MRVQRRFLLGSRWTAVAPIDGGTGERHFEVIEVAVRRAHVTLRAVLTGREHEVPISTLEDPAAWVGGWRSLATDAPTDVPTSAPTDAPTDATSTP